MILSALSLPIPIMAQQPTIPAPDPFQEIMNFLVSEPRLFPRVGNYESIESPEHCIVVTTDGFLNPCDSKGRIPVKYQVINLRSVNQNNFPKIYDGINLQCRQPGCFNVGEQYTFGEANWKQSNDALIRFPESSVICAEKVSGPRRDRRTELQVLLDFLQTNHTLIVTRIEHQDRNSKMSVIT